MIFTAACMALLYSGFCRLVRTSTSTRLDVRLAVYALTVAALIGLYASLFLGYNPGWPGTTLVVAMVFVQAVTSRLWRRGVPESFLERGTP
jgi:ABC-type dipeptide/oligopeptide/nickel transport system permease subunit